MIVRSIHLGFEVPDADAAQATLYYPADEAALGDARLTGIVAADVSAAPWPIVILVPGINVAPDAYRWLACRLVESGCCAVTYSTIGALGPAGRGITPGIDLAALDPAGIGARCSATAIVPLLMALQALDPSSPPAAHIDFDRVVLGGHSAGGTVVLHNSDPAWIPGLRAVFAYAGHTMTATSLGHDEASVAAIPAQVPVLLLGGSGDAVIAASRDRYRNDGALHDPVGRTFHEALSRDKGDSWLVELVDGNHFSVCDPVDETSGRSFLEPELRADDRAVRDLLASVIVAFVQQTVQTNVTGSPVGDLMTSPGVERWSCR